MSVDAGSVYSSIRVRLGDLDNDLKGVYARLGQLETKISHTTTNANTGFKNMFLGVASGQAAIQLVQKGFQLLVGAVKDSIKVSIDAQETFSKYDAVFSGMGRGAEDAATSFAASFDLAGVSAKDMLANSGDLLQGFGATREESLKLSVQVNTLASDLTSFTNYSGGARGASVALTKALLGERESAKELGIAILESDVQTRLAEKGQDKLTGTALKLAKAQVTLELITEQAKNSIGDYARTHDSAANTIKRSTEATINLQVALGTALNPAAAKSAQIWGDVAIALTKVLVNSNAIRDARKSEEEGNASSKQRSILLEDEAKKIEILTSKYLPLPGILKTIQGVAKIASKGRIDDINKEIAALSVQTAVEENIARYKQAVIDNDRKAAEKEAENIKKLSDANEAKSAKDQEQIDARVKAEYDYNNALEKTQFNKDKFGISDKEVADQNLSSAKTYIDTLYELGYANDNEIGTKGRAALDSLIEKYPELVKAVKLLGSESEHITYEMAIDWNKVTENGIQNAVSGFESLGEAMAEGTLGWQAFAKSGLLAIASVIEGIAMQMTALAAKEIAFYGFFNPVGWAAAGGDLAKAAGVYVLAGLVKGYAGTFATGGIVPGSSYTGDNMVANVNSGEMILNGGQQKALFDMISGMASNNGNINPSTTPIYLDGKEIAKVVTRYQRNNKA